MENASFQQRGEQFGGVNVRPLDLRRVQQNQEYREER